MYTKLATIYDATYHFVDYEKSASYLIDAIRSRLPTASSLLEIACGTGRYLEILGKTYYVEGLDLSPEMLAKAKERLPAVRLHQGDMASFALDRRYDVVCCLFRSIAYAGSVKNLFSTVQAMADRLTVGGLVMIEPFFTPESYWVNKVVLNQYTSEELKIAWMYVSEKNAAGARVRMNYLVGTPAGVEHFVETHDLGLFSDEDFKQAFTAAGLALEYDPKGPGGLGMYFGHKV